MVKKTMIHCVCGGCGYEYEIEFNRLKRSCETDVEVIECPMCGSGWLNDEAMEVCGDIWISGLSQCGCIRDGGHRGECICTCGRTHRRN